MNLLTQSSKGLESNLTLWKRHSFFAGELRLLAWVVEHFDAKIAEQHDENSQATDARRDVRAGLPKLDPVLSCKQRCQAMSRK